MGVVCVKFREDRLWSLNKVSVVVGRVLGGEDWVGFEFGSF